mmetsp:Transcript_11025/g.16579  ORF Transcript_11025/g.16579 Transcript_11025/m.16579 type:complete len:336 (+) Transcript_11025:66-1073(+)
MNFANIFSSSEAKVITKIPESSLTESQKKLFNGFDELGGDIGKYSDAIDWFSNCKSKNEAIVLCLVVLSKPSSYLMGGIRNEERKEYMEVVKKLLPRLENYEYAEGIMKDRLKEQMELIVDECKVMKLVDGVAIFDGEKKSTMDELLTRSMPLFTSSEIESFDVDQINNMKSVRMWWKGRFKLVNVSRMKRLAMMYLELCPQHKLNSQGAKWINSHGGRPSKATKFGTNSETERILKEDIGQMKADKALWAEYKNVFLKKLHDEGLVEELPELDDIQTGFMEKIGSVDKMVISGDNEDGSGGTEEDLIGGVEDGSDGANDEMDRLKVPVEEVDVL